MRAFLITTIYCFILWVPSISRAQHGYWQWAHTGADQGLSETNKVATDNVGNVYATGSFTGEIKLGSTTLVSSGKADVFIAKYDPAGKVLWARSLGGPEEDAGVGIAVDTSGNIYVTGSYVDTLTDGNIVIKGFGSKDIFLAKYNSIGGMSWIKRAGGVYEENVADVCIDNQEHIIICGTFGTYPASPTPDTALAYFENDTLFAYKGTELFIVKYDYSGNVLWSKALGGENNTGIVGSINVDKYDNITIGGAFSNYLVLDHITLISNAVGFVVSDMFVAKLNSVGQVIWAHNVSGNKSWGQQTGGAIWWGYVACNDAGDVYITGSYLDCDMIFPTVTLKSTGSSNIYIAKYSASGTFQWAKKPFDAFSFAWGITATDKDEVYITGDFKNVVAIGNNTLISAGADDVFIGKYDANGNDIWGVSGGGEGRDYSRSIATGKDGRLYIGGGFNSGAATFGSHFISSGNDYNMFVAAYHGFPTGVSDNAVAAAFSVYPNPVYEHLIVEGAAQGTIVQLFNVMGQEVLHATITKHTETFSTAQLLPGMYFLTLTDAQGNKETRRIVKQ